MDPERQEALSTAYNTQRIVRLSTGRLALFSHWDNSTGIDLLAIGTFAELEPLIGHAPRPAFAPAIPTADLLDLIGLAAPKIKRRF